MADDASGNNPNAPYGNQIQPTPMPAPGAFRAPGAPYGIERRFNPAGATPAPAVAPVAHGPQVVLNEHPLRVTLLIRLVKIKPPVK